MLCFLCVSSVFLFCAISRARLFSAQSAQTLSLAPAHVQHGIAYIAADVWTGKGPVEEGAKGKGKGKGCKNVRAQVRSRKVLKAQTTCLTRRMVRIPMVTSDDQHHHRRCGQGGSSTRLQKSAMKSRHSQPRRMTSKAPKESLPSAASQVEKTKMTIDIEHNIANKRDEEQALTTRKRRSLSHK